MRWNDRHRGRPLDRSKLASIEREETESSVLQRFDSASHPIPCRRDPGQKVVEGSVAGFRRDIGRKAIDDPGLPFKSLCVKILQRNRHANAVRLHRAHITVKIAVLEMFPEWIRTLSPACISDVFSSNSKVKGSASWNNPNIDQAAKIFLSGVCPAVIQQLRKFLFRSPSFAFDQPRETPEVGELRRFLCAGPIAENTGGLLALRPHPGRARPANVFIEAFVAKFEVR